MKIDFGAVKKYLTDRGFGFVNRTFITSHQSEVFFHIKTLKRTQPELAEKLSNDELIEDVYFWYEIEDTAKGEQVRTVLRPSSLKDLSIENLTKIAEKIESIWRNTYSDIPHWLRDVTFDLLGKNRGNDLIFERKNLEIEQKKIEDQQRKEREEQQRIEEEKRQRRFEEQRIQEEIEEKEFQQLVAEMMPLGLTHSSQVSRYIVNNKLGYKYRNISGIVKMEQDGTIWDFKGGFPPKIYAKLCKELGLSNNGTRAKPIGFESFKDLQGNR